MQTPQPKQVVRFQLTPEQQEQLKRATGREGESIELTVEELEERVMPMSAEGRLASNHNETLLVDG